MKHSVESWPAGEYSACEADSVSSSAQRLSELGCLCPLRLRVLHVDSAWNVVMPISQCVNALGQEEGVVVESVKPKRLRL